MSDAPIPIRSRTVVQALKDALEMAERGELRSVAIAYEHAKEHTGHLLGFGVGCWTTALVGEVDAMKLSIHVHDGRLHQ